MEGVAATGLGVLFMFFAGYAVVYVVLHALVNVLDRYALLWWFGWTERVVNLFSLAGGGLGVALMVYIWLLTPWWRSLLVSLLLFGISFAIFVYLLSDLLPKGLSWIAFRLYVFRYLRAAAQDRARQLAFAGAAYAPDEPYGFARRAGAPPAPEAPSRPAGPGGVPMAPHRPAVPGGTAAAAEAEYDDTPVPSVAPPVRRPVRGPSVATRPAPARAPGHRSLAPAGAQPFSQDDPYQNLLVKAKNDKALVNRLIELERGKAPPDTSFDELCRRAIIHWERDNR